MLGWGYAGAGPAPYLQEKEPGAGCWGVGTLGQRGARPSRAAAGEQRTAAIARACPAPPRPPFVPVGSRPFGAGPVLVLLPW